MDGVSVARTSGYEPASALFKALVSPVRVVIVHLPPDRERAMGQFAETLGLPQPLVLQHLRVLRGALMVIIRRQGQKIWYGVCDQHIAHILGDTIEHTQEGKHDHGY